MKKNTFLELKPIQKFVTGLGQDIKKYIGKDKACIIGLGDDGVFYGKGLYQWLLKEGKNDGWHVWLVQRCFSYDLRAVRRGRLTALQNNFSIEVNHVSVQTCAPGWSYTVNFSLAGFELRRRGVARSTGNRLPSTLNRMDRPGERCRFDRRRPAFIHHN